MKKTIDTFFSVIVTKKPLHKLSIVERAYCISQTMEKISEKNLKMKWRNFMVYGKPFLQNAETSPRPTEKFCHKNDTSNTFP